MRGDLQSLISNPHRTGSRWDHKKKSEEQKELCKNSTILILLKIVYKTIMAINYAPKKPAIPSNVFVSSTAIIALRAKRLQHVMSRELWLRHKVFVLSVAITTWAGRHAEWAKQRITSREIHKFLPWSKQTWYQSHFCTILHHQSNPLLCLFLLTLELLSFHSYQAIVRALLLLHWNL